MARSLTTIYNSLAQEKANMGQLREWITDPDNPRSKLDDSQNLLNDLTSTRKVAEWRLLLWVVAFGIWIHEQMWDIFRKEVDTKIANEVVHTPRWYRSESLKFQYGDALVWVDGEGFQYELIDTNKQVVKYCAVNEGNGMITLKIATELSGVKQPLTSAQEAAFKAFWQKHKDAGVLIEFVNTNPDILFLQYTVHYDPLVLKSDGTLIDDATVKPVEQALKQYLNTLPFNGAFNLNKAIDAIQEAEGVVDVVQNLAQSKFGNNDYTDINRQVIPYSGYFIIDPENTLDKNTTYVAHA